MRNMCSYFKTLYIQVVPHDETIYFTEFEFKKEETESRECVTRQ